ncbi:hypothetical protein sscle_13g093520 [Sclerotinia sclerotiorum 1980 UF-70]|uniref:Uncharacterized protein n=1 Tax=Sclerotinia sclerotiorum (strain ATCC 18683 / 1980 / Ss-1) TaxID=665079 RepID=A0A1D9QIG1_SCLS1|nr:hypothetical protein sscle_13g093520 [Sclerotinia sclerotiorum 1980 UF-70]
MKKKRKGFFYYIIESKPGAPSSFIFISNPHANNYTVQSCEASCNPPQQHNRFIHTANRKGSGKRNVIVTTFKENREERKK